jgi:hypothetical protein
MYTLRPLAMIAFSIHKALHFNLINLLALAISSGVYQTTTIEKKKKIAHSQYFRCLSWLFIKYNNGRYEVDQICLKLSFIRIKEFFWWVSWQLESGGQSKRITMSNLNHRTCLGSVSIYDFRKCIFKILILKYAIWKSDF